MIKSKEEYLKEAEARLEVREAEIDRLKSQLTMAQQNFEEDGFMRALRESLANAKTHVQQLDHAGDEAWEVMREGVENAFDELQTAMSEAASKFKEVQ